MSEQTLSLYRGLCEASAAVFIGADRFAVASDETNILRIYHRGTEGLGQEVPLDLPGGEKADLEAAARIGDLVYWVSSHSVAGGQADAKRKKHKRSGAKAGRKRRRGLVATRIVAGPEGETLQQVGVAGDIAGPLLAALGGQIDPGALNIEGMAATPDGRLMLGLRNMLGTSAVVAILDNPGEVLAGAVARFGAACLLDLGAMGIRSLEEYSGGYLLVAGPEGDEGSFALFSWPGPGFAPVELSGVAFDGLRPEVLMVLPDGQTVQVLCDDGSDSCSDEETPPDQRAFRSLDLPLASLRPRPVP